MNEPEKVIPPINVPIMMVIPVVLTPTAGDATNSATATKADAPPPNALKMPTNWGILVISTKRAAIPPIDPPNTIPIRIPVQGRISWSANVATIASNMARAAKPLPARAVAGD